MPKFSGLVTEYKEQENKKAEQQALHEKYHIQDENVKIVESSNMAKYSINTFIRLVKLLATIIILVLAAIGLTALIYPEARESLLAIFSLAAEQTTEMIGG